MRSSLFSGGEVPQLEVPLLDGRLEVPGPPLLPVATHAGVHLGVHHLYGGHRLEQSEHFVVEKFAQVEVLTGSQEARRDLLPGIETVISQGVAVHAIHTVCNQCPLDD